MINYDVINFKIMPFLNEEDSKKMTLMNKNSNHLNNWNKLTIDYCSANGYNGHRIKEIEKYKIIKINEAILNSCSLYKKINNMINVNIIFYEPESIDESIKLTKNVNDKILKINKSLHTLKLKKGGFIMRYLVEELKINQSIRVLYFTSRNLSDSKYIGELIKENKNIKILTLLNNNDDCKEIQEFNYEPIFEGLKYNKTLKKLVLKDNDRYYSNFNNISNILDALKCNQTLQELYLPIITISFCKETTKDTINNYKIKLFNINNKEIKILCDILKINKTIKTIKLKHEMSYYLYYNEEHIGLNIEYNQNTQTLDMIDSCLDAEGYEYIVDAFDDRSIKILNLENCNLGDNKCKYIYELLKRHTEIEILNLTNNNIRSVDCQYLIDGLQKLKVLRILNLSNNKIDKIGCSYLYEGLKYTKTLERLNTEDGIKNGWNEYLIQILEKNPDIKFLDLKCVKNVNNNKLEELNLEETYLNSQDSLYIGKLIREHNTLCKIKINKSNITNIGIEHICNGLKNNKSIKSLYIKGLDQDQQLKHLRHGLVNNQVIEELILHSTKISLISSKYLAEIIENNSSIKILSLVYSSNLTEKNFKTIYVALINNNTIESLDLSCCDIFRDGMTNEISNLACEHKSLKLLTLDFCNGLGNQDIEYLNHISNYTIKGETYSTHNYDDY